MENMSHGTKEKTQWVHVFLFKCRIIIIYADTKNKEIQKITQLPRDINCSSFTLNNSFCFLYSMLCNKIVAHSKLDSRTRTYFQNMEECWICNIEMHSVQRYDKYTEKINSTKQTNKYFKCSSLLFSCNISSTNTASFSKWLQFFHNFAK